MSRWHVSKCGLTTFIAYMAIKVNIPDNNLGPFLTFKRISSIDIHAKTSIPSDELSKLRNGVIKSISANKLFLISMVSKIDIKEMLEGVYPNLKLKPLSPKQKKAEFKSLQDFFNYVEGDIIEFIAERTDITPYRLKKIKHNKVIPSAHELYLIELATKTKPGTLFNILYKDLQLNTAEVEAKLRAEEKARSRS